MDGANTREAELRALMLASLQGDASAHRGLLSALSGHLRGFYRRGLVQAGRGPGEIEDLVQEALMAVHTQRHTYDPNELLTPWVYAIARYKLIDHLRRNKSRQADVAIEEAFSITASEEQSAAESTHDLNKLLGRLPEKVRLAIQYVKVQGLSVAEAADRCGISESAVKTNIHRGLKALSSAIAQEKPDENR